jgi:hypothetical protein
MKHYLVKLDIQAGEFEKQAIHLVQAENRDAAVMQAMEDEAHDDLEYNDICEFWEDGCGEFAYRASNVYLIEDVGELAVLKKYLHGYNAGI